MLGGNAPATAGADYTATSGTLVFTAGDRRKTVSVAVLNDSLDEGAEYFLLELSNPQGAHLPHRQVEKVGLIRNDDPLQQAWLSRFGRTVGSQVTDAVSERLEGLPPGVPRDTGGPQRGPVARGGRRGAGRHPAEAGAALRRAGDGDRR